MAASRRERRRRNAGSTHGITEGVKSALAQIAASTIHPHEGDELVEAPAEVVVAVVEERPKRRKKRADAPVKPTAELKSEKEILLDSVLSALPEPKAPGQGRGRRRVTTALSAAPRSYTARATDQSSSTAASWCSRR